LQLVDIIKSTIRDINKNRVASVLVDLSALSRQVLDKETLAEMEQLFLQVCGEIHEKLQNSEQDKNTVLMDAIKEIVATNYSDMNLSLQGIASMLRMTPAYVGRMFKQSELVSVGEYINEIRLSHALEYLETKNFSIKEIMELVGYLNESTFFKLFKKRYGVTPKEYRLKRNIS
jgi:YesN/AraC family two-component response regulator